MRELLGRKQSGSKVLPYTAAHITRLKLHYSFPQPQRCESIVVHLISITIANNDHLQATPTSSTTMPHRYEQVESEFIQPSPQSTKMDRRSLRDIIGGPRKPVQFQLTRFFKFADGGQITVKLKVKVTSASATAAELEALDREFKAAQVGGGPMTKNVIRGGDRVELAMNDLGRVVTSAVEGAGASTVQ